MNDSNLCSLALVGLLAISTMGYAAGQQGPAELREERMLKKMIPELQTRLKEFSISADTDRKFKSNKEAAIREWADVDKTELVRQIFLFLRTNRFVDEMEGWRIAGLFNSLALTDEEKAAAILPLLDTSDNALRKLLYEELESIDEKDHGRSHDFAVCSKLIRERKDDPPHALLRYIFHRDPKEAVLSMSRVYGDKATESQLAEELKGDPKAGLQSLADRPEWWAHLYVAAMMEKEPYLRTPELVKKLEQDTDPLVREKVSKLKDQLQPK